MKDYTAQTTRNKLTISGKGHTTILTSFRRNGTGVGTPVGTVASQGKLYFMTAAHTAKVKRLVNNPRVTVALGTFQGKTLSPAIEGTAHRLTGKEIVMARSLLRVGALGHFWGLIYDLRYPGDKTAVYEILLETSDVDQELKATSSSQH